MTTWLAETAVEMAATFDPGPIITFAPDEAAFNVTFDDGYGLPNGPPVLAWTKTRVYFPVCCGGAEAMGSAPRDPVSSGQEHVGGW